MAIEFKLPNLGENIESGDVVNVLVKEGDEIKANQGVIEIETDKAVIEVPSTQGGRVSKVHVKAGPDDQGRLDGVDAGAGGLGIVVVRRTGVANKTGGRRGQEAGTSTAKEAQPQAAVQAEASGRFNPQSNSASRSRRNGRARRRAQPSTGTSLEGGNGRSSVEEA